MMGHARYPTAVDVVCPPRTHGALWALLPHSLTRGWGSSGSAAWGPRAVPGSARGVAEWHA
jgi:hypothetical protein